MANKGKRMVAEDLIKQIGQTGPTYTAGTNISISDENVISATDTTYTAGFGIEINNGVISTNVDPSNGIIAYYTDQVLEIQTDNSVVKKPQYQYTVKPGVNPVDPADPSQGTYTVTIADFLKDLPILMTGTFKPATDATYGNNPVIDLVKDNPMENTVFLKGFFGIRDTDNDVINIMCTAGTNSSYDDTALIGKLQNAEITRYGTNNWKFKNVRTNRTVTFTESATSTSIQVLMVGYADGTDTGVAATMANGEANVPIKIVNPVIGTNYAQQVVVPSTQGTYVLKATVDANGQVTNLQWVAEV